MDLTAYGEAFRTGEFRFPIPQEAFGERPLHKKLVRLILLYLHLAAGVVWFGTMFYVHIIIKPQTFTQGLPKAELGLGWVCILVVSLTGAVLSLSRVLDFSQLYTTKFGVILSAKIILFLMLLTIAVLTTFVVQRRLMQKVRQNKADENRPKTLLSHTELLSFNGRDGQPSYVAVGGQVYDLSDSPSWEEGRHMGQHFAGGDLSEALLDAPHGRDVLTQFKRVGRIWETPVTREPPIRSVRGLFLFLARSALVISFLILFCVVLWRWG
jgi:predicted heme/steroid binding protein